MTSPFDFDRYDWYPNSLGRPRPKLRTPLDVFGVHYAGAGLTRADLVAG